MKITTQTALNKQSNSYIGGVLIFLFITLLSYATHIKTPYHHPITKDAKENVIASYYLWTKGIISLNGEKKSNYREPLPIAVLATHVALFTNISQQESMDALTNNPVNIKKINAVNLYYIIPSFFAIWWLTWLLTKSNMLSFIAIYASWSVFYIESWYLARPLTEFAASLFLLLIAGVSIKTFQQQGKPNYLYAILLGTLIGALALTKAVAFYVSIVAVLFIGYGLVRYQDFSVKNAIKFSVTTYAIIFMIVTPWIIRNMQLPSSSTSVSTDSISSRGSQILLGRANMNANIANNFTGSIYAYSPRLLQHNVFEKYWGFKASDLLGDGKYAKFDRRNAFLNKNRNDQTNTVKDLTEEKHQKNSSVVKIITSPFDHLLATISIIWRGIWSFDGGNHLSPGGKTITSVSLNFFSFVSFLVIPVIGLYKRRIDWLAFSLFAYGYFWIYAIFTHFIPRYSAPLIPITIISFLLIVSTVITNLRKLKVRP